MTTLRILTAKEYPEGKMKNCIVFTSTRLKLVRLINFINHAGFDSRYIKSNSVRQAPNLAWYAVWRISTRTVEARLFKEEYDRAKGIVEQGRSPYKSRSVRLAGLIARLREMD